MTSFLIRNRNGEGTAEEEEKEGHMKKEAEIFVVMQPQAKECLQPPQPEEVRKDFPIELLKEAQSYCHLDFRFLASRTVRE
jgi:hypothetical protein